MHTLVCKGDGPGLGAGLMVGGGPRQPEPGVSKVLGLRSILVSSAFKPSSKEREGCPSVGAWPFREGMGWLGQGGGSRSLPSPTRPRVAGRPSPPPLPARRQYRTAAASAGRPPSRASASGVLGPQGPALLLHQLTSSPQGLTQSIYIN